MPADRISFWRESWPRERRAQITQNLADNSKPLWSIGIQLNSCSTLLLNKSNLLTSSRETLKLCWVLQEDPWWRCMMGKSQSTLTHRRWPLKCCLYCLFCFNQHWASSLYVTNYLMESKKTQSCFLHINFLNINIFNCIFQLMKTTLFFVELAGGFLC